jgi:hypothetical protein
MTTRSRWITISLALLGAGGFAIAVEGGQWWTVAGVPIGPFGSVNCFDGECHATSLEWVGGNSLWLRSATATTAAGLIAMVLLIAMAGTVAARRVPRQLAKLVLVAIATAVACAAWFVTHLPELPGTSIDRGLLTFAIAVVVGALSAIRLFKR